MHAMPAQPDPADLPLPNVASHEKLDAFRSRQLEDFLADVSFEGLDWDIREREGMPFEVIVESVRDLQADLVVMGTHGRSGLERLFLGSTADKVLRRMPASVLTVRTRDG